MCDYIQGGSDGKEGACNVGDLGFIPRSGRSPGEGNAYPFQYSCLENSMNRGAWWGYIPWGRKELDMTERLTLSLSLTVTNNLGLGSQVLGKYMI